VNTRAASLQPLHVCPRHIIHGVHVFEIELKGHELVFKGIPARTFQALEVAR
jgi:hypothetical protein